MRRDKIAFQKDKKVNKLYTVSVIMPAKKNVEKNSASQQEIPMPPVGLPPNRKAYTCTEFIIQQLLQIIETSIDSKVCANKTALLSEEELTLALTSCAANALHNTNSVHPSDDVPRTYWVDLGQQIEVDRWVEFSRYCAANGFRPLKAKHLMECLLSFKQLIEQGKLHEEDKTGEGRKCITTHQQTSQASPTNDNTLSSSPNGSDMLANTSKGEEIITTAVEVGLPPTPFWMQIQQHLKDFVTREIDLGYKWERVHHSVDAFSGVSPVGAGPMSSVSTQRLDEEAGFGLEKPPAAAAIVKRKGKSEKPTRQQQLLQQQQEQLDEERRQIAASMSASMPSENIYLTPDEIPDFVNYLYRGLLQHSALYQYLSKYPQTIENKVEEFQTGSTDSFLLLLEEPMPIPPLNLSTEMLSTYSATVEPAPSIPIKNGRANTFAATLNSNTVSSTVEATGTLSPLPGKGLEAGSREKVSKSPLDLFQDMQKQEIDRLAIKYHEEIAKEERRARAEQIEKEMTLFFEMYGTQKAVDDIYTSIDSEVRQQQWRILQRVKALEVALGIN
ncbi:unnamed protein product [Phytomonas sp. EM1]|nr:unnamed protein product [Phytomonas sp. EM1]|eukprot:CCW61131.1 unnamed protein product [Phytomonas sp. isolate EM1]